MPTAIKEQSKTSFVQEFLSDHPEGNVKAVNEAWTAAGYEGTIGDTVIYKTRAEMGLSGNQRGKTTTSFNGKSARTSPAAAPSSLGKSSFVKEFLNDNPLGTVKTVNEAWQAAGFTGTVSPTLVNKMRAALGLTGNLRATSKPKASMTGKKRGRPPKDTTAAFYGIPAGQTQASNSDRSSALLGVEAEIDRLIFHVMGLGDLTEIETALREARRKVYGAMSS